MDFFNIVQSTRRDVSADFLKELLRDLGISSLRTFKPSTLEMKEKNTPVGCSRS